MEVSRKVGESSDDNFPEYGKKETGMKKKASVNFQKEKCIKLS